MAAEFEGKEVVAKGKDFAIFLAAVIFSGFLFYFLLRNMSQTLAATIFLATVIGTLMFWRFRVAIAFLGIVLLLLTRTIDLKHTLEFMSLDVILFLVGMMVIVGLLRQSGFFRWLLVRGLKLAGFKPNSLMVMFLFLAALMAALVDEVTSILFVTALLLEFCDYFKLRPVNYIISVVLATNIGSSWTVLGNPIGILIALRSGLTFEDFIRTAFPIGLICLISLMVIALLWQRSDLRLLGDRIRDKPIKEHLATLDEWAKIRDRKLFTGSAVIFLLVIISLALHYRMELLFGLEKNTLLVGTSITGAGVVMLWQRHQARALLQNEVDWWTLTFFLFLFAKAGCLKFVGLTDVITDSLLKIAGGGNVPFLTAMILWISGIASAAMDNVVVIAALVPIIHSLTPHAGSPVLWWASLFGGCYGGNMTMVGSTANIIALGILEGKKGYHMTLSYWIKIGFWGAVVPMAIGTLALIVLFA